MGYQLGVDIGTTHTAAAVLRRGRAEMVTLGDDTVVIPSVVFRSTDEVIVVGEAASEQGFSDPTRVARAFKRRLGDPTPTVLGGRAYSADDLMAELLRRVVEIVSEQEGGPPELVTVTHPAHWGAYRTDLVRQVIRSAGLESVRIISDPVAAALWYESTDTMAEGEVVLVYDLGGGTFDAALARRTTEGFEILGGSEGIDRLGGIDFDEAVLVHMSAAVGVGPEDFDLEDPATVAALAGLRAECAVVKESLSTATEVSVPVFLPGGEREVQVTREDLNAMVRPALTETIELVRRILGAAHLEAGDVDAVVLVGGSCRIPLVAQLVSEALGRPVAVAAEPEHAVALGAALSMAPVFKGSEADEHDAPPSSPEVTDGVEPGSYPTSAASSNNADTPATPPEVDPSSPAEGVGLAAPAEAPKSTEDTGTTEDTGSTRGDTADATAAPDPPSTPTEATEATEAVETSTSSPGTGSGTEASGGAKADDPTLGHPEPSSMSLGMSVAAAVVALAMIGAAAGAGSLIGAGKVSTGIGLIVLAAVAGVALLLIVKRPARRHSEASGAVERREGSSL